MRTSVTLKAIATDVVGHYGHASKSLVSAYRSASQRALAASGTGYAKLVERAPLPLVGEQRKARLIAAERRVAKVVGDGVARTAQGCDRAIEVVVGQVLKGLEGFAQRTEWTKDMFVVDTLRRVNLPAAKLSLGIASRIDDAATTLSARAGGAVKHRVAKRATKKQPAGRVVRAAAKRVRRAA
ncbi:MAG TPA: hypothetical protein VLD35_18265 [Caldimonas sp.]|nr:hypothetical protein [Caldimonas sp.]